MHIDPVNDAHPRSSVNEIANRSAKDHRQSDPFRGACFRFPDHPDDQDRREYGYNNEKVALPSAGRGQKTERRSLVDHMDDVQQG